MAQRIRTVFFWLHLTAGLLAGVVVLIMSATGVLLTFEKQLIYYADTRAISLTPPPSATPLPIDTLLARVRATGLVGEPSAVAVRRDPAAPVALTIGQGVVAYADPYTGRLLGRGDRRRPRLLPQRHRLAPLARGERRVPGHRPRGHRRRQPRLPVPRPLGRLPLDPAHLGLARGEQVIWFRGGLPGKARDFNWHNTIGVWSVVPLAIVVASGGHLLSLGEQPGLPDRRRSAAGAGGGGAGGEAAPARAEGARCRRRAGAKARRPRGPRRRERAATRRRRRRSTPPGRPPSPTGPRGGRITLRLPAAPAPTLAFTIDDGGPGQPQYRGTLTVDRASGAVAKWEGFEAVTPRPPAAHRCCASRTPARCSACPARPSPASSRSAASSSSTPASPVVPPLRRLAAPAVAGRRSGGGPARRLIAVRRPVRPSASHTIIMKTRTTSRRRRRPLRPRRAAGPPSASSPHRPRSPAASPPPPSSCRPSSGPGSSTRCRRPGCATSAAPRPT